MSGKLKALVHVESAAGLGHHAGISRVVSSLTRLHGVDVTVASGTFVDPQKFYPQATIHKLPDLYIKRDGEYFYWGSDGEKVPYAGLNIDQWSVSRTTALLDVYRELKPDVFITECWPFMRPEFDAELSAVSAASRREGIKTLFVSSMRDILREVVDPSTRGTTPCPERISVGARMLDAILIHSDPNFVNFDSTFAHVDAVGRDKIHYTGYIADTHPKPRQLGATGLPVVVSVGSGCSGDTMLNLALNAWELSPTFFKQRQWHFVTGPRYGRAAFREFLMALQSRQGTINCPEEGLYSARAQFILSNYVKDFPALLSKSDLSISLGGYNTTMEVLQSDTPGVILPKMWITNGVVSRYDFEQRARSTLLEKGKLTSTVTLEDIPAPGKLVDAMHRAVAFVTGRATDGLKLNFAGAETSANLICALWEQKVRGLTAVSAPG